MDPTQQIHTANRLIELLGQFGVPKADAADAAGVARTTLFNWQMAEKKPESPTAAPGDQQIAALANHLIEHLREQFGHLREFLDDGGVRPGARRGVAEGSRAVLRDALAELDRLVALWERFDQALAELVEEHGPVASEYLVPRREFASDERPHVLYSMAANCISDRSDARSAPDLPDELLRKTYRYKYQAVFDVLMHADEDATAADLAAQVRCLFPRGTFLPYRIGEDIGHLLRGDGVYTKLARSLSPEQIEHLERLQANLKKRGDFGR